MTDYQELKRLAEACIAEERKCPDDVLTIPEARAYNLLLRDYEDAANPAAVLELISEVEALRKDAQRYQWLRSRLPGSSYRVAGVMYSEGGDGVDVAIDAAMLKESDNG